MSLKSLKNSWLQFVRDMNHKGVPVPMIRDPKYGIGSVSLTLVFISFNVWLISVIGKAAGALGGLDQNQTFNMFIAACSLYWGRKFQKDGDKKVELTQEKENGKSESEKTE